MEAAWLEGRIRQEFDKLREFLRVEEQAILDATAEEARQKQRLVEEKMKRLAEDTEALAHEIERLQAEMKEDDVSFLMVRGSPSGFGDGGQALGRPPPAQSSLSVGVLGGRSPRRRCPACQEAKRIFSRAELLRTFSLLPAALLSVSLSLPLL